MDYRCYCDHGFVYFIKNKSNGLTKIGYTKYTPIKRFRELSQTFKNLEFKFCIPTDMPERLERKMHKKFYREKVKGEWFKLIVDDYKEVKSLYKTINYMTYDPNIFGDYYK